MGEDEGEGERGGDGESESEGEREGGCESEGITSINLFQEELKPVLRHFLHFIK